MIYLIVAIIEELLLGLGSIIAAGFLIYFINKGFYKLFPYHERLLYYSTGIIGIPIHELSHALLCIIFAHKIERVEWFNTDPDAEYGGCVYHTYNPKNIYQRIGNLFIGVAPIIVGSIIVAICYYFVSSNSFVNIMDTTKDLIITNDLSFSKAFLSVFYCIKIVFINFFCYDNVTFWGWWLFLFLSPLITLHMTLSGADIKNSFSGVLFTLIFVILINVILFFISDSIFASFFKYYTIYSAYLISILIICVFTAIISYLVAFIFSLILKIFKRKL